MSSFSSSSSNNSVCVDVSMLQPSVPSLCIPRVFSNITKERVAFVIQNVGLGEIDHIDMVPRVAENGDKFQRVFIHFKEWSKSSTAQRARERVLSGKEIKIVYDEPWFWKLSANRSSNSRTGGARTLNSSARPNRGPRLIDEDSSSSDNDDKLVSRKQQQQQTSRYHGNNRNSRPFKKVSESTAAATAAAATAATAVTTAVAIQDIDKPSDGSWTTVSYGDCKPTLLKKKHNKGTPTSVLVEESKKSDSV